MKIKINWAALALALALNVAATLILFCSEPSDTGTVTLYAAERIAQVVGAFALYALSLWVALRGLPRDFMEE